jgi:Family of unknown function (DUF6444)
VERAEAEAIYEQGRDVVVRVLLELSAQNERLSAQVETLSARVARQDERIAQLERRLNRSSHNSSQPPSQDPPATPPRRNKDPSGRARGAQSGHAGSGRELLPACAVDELIEHWPTRCACGHVFCHDERRPSAEPVRHQAGRTADLRAAAAPGPLGARRAASQDPGGSCQAVPKEVCHSACRLQPDCRNWR